MMPENRKFKLPILLLSTLILSKIITAQNEPARIRIDSAYKAEIEATFVTDKYTMAIQEHFQTAFADIPEKGSIVQTVRGRDMKIVFDYSANSLFIVADGKCHFRNISTYYDNILTGNYDPLAKYPIITSKDAMRFIQDSQPQLISNSTMIRGIETSQWRFPLQIKGSSDFHVDTYFTNEWNSEGGTKKSIPVRFDASGKFGKKDYQVIFDYYFFEYISLFSFEEENNAFELPGNVYCKGTNVSVPLPEIADAYSYTVEIVDPMLYTVEVSKVWYDSENQLFRQDSHPDSYALSGYPVSKIYDLKTGVVYAIDNILQNCSVQPIKQNKNNGIVVGPADKKNKINLELRDPLALLQDDTSFAFVEQRIRRNIICNVFMTQQNISRDGKIIGKALFVYYFMSDDWRLYPDFGGPDEKLTNIPILLDVYLQDQEKSETDAEMLLYRTYNFIDFTTGVSPEAFNIPQCYSSNTEIFFRIAFVGQLIPSMMNQMRKKFHSLIADNTGVFPHRVQRMSIHADSSFVFVRAAIIDRTKPEAQFSLIKNKQLVSNVKTTIQNSNLHSCSSKCISSFFVCAGFDLSNDGVCRLTDSKLTNAASQLKSSTTSNYYSRTVVGQSIEEPSVIDVWKKLTSTIYNGNFIAEIDDPSTKEKTKYIARTVELLSGVIDVEGNPIFPLQMSYRIEFSEPVMERVNFFAVWYDSQRKLLRADQRFFEPKAPFYSLNPLTIISDFSEGVTYHIDQVLGNCTILPLEDKKFDTDQQKRDNTTILKMKSPDELFKMDSKFKFYGQKTVRGILCDVYEAIRNDFTVPGVQHPTIATFRYCFVNDKWVDRSDTGSTEIVAYTPLQLEIMSSIVNYYAVFNFFDYSDDIPPMDVFDIRSCFEKKTQYQFQIVFSGAKEVKYDSLEFIQKAETEIAKTAKVNILRIQEAVLESDSKNIYLTANLLTYPPAKAHFRKLPSKVLNRKEDKSIANVKSVDECADKCIKETGFICNSFDFCSDGSVSCKLSKLYSPDGKKLNNNKVCDHYTRVVAGAKRPIEPLVAIGILKDAVASGNFSISLSVSPDNPDMIQTYKAIKFRDDVTTTDSIRLTMDNNIKKFDRYKNDVTIVKSEQMHYYPQMAVDDCANICLVEPTYKCESFAFCFSQGDCYVSGSHPDQKPEMLEAHKGCSVYNRNYLYRYDKEPGVSTVTTGDKPVGVTSASDCAKQCTTNDDFFCQSFQYCSQINECTLSKVHKMDIPDEEIKGNIMCDIYFRKYVDDFTVSKGRRISLVNNQVLTDISEEQCAKACMEEENFNCAGFDYCANTTECRLTNPDTFNSGQVTMESSAFCNHFKRKPISYTSHTTVKKETIYSKSHLTAVALSTLFASFVFGTLFMTIFLRRKPTVSI